MVKKKIKSKRIKAAKLHKAEKLARRNKSQKRRLARKMEKKHPNQVVLKGRVKGVPNLWPFKAQFLSEMEEAQREEELMKQRDRERIEQEHEEKRLARENERAERQKARLEAAKEKSLKDFCGELTAGEHIQHLNTMFGEVDALIEVVDARDPKHLRSEVHEYNIKKLNKPFLVVLAKSDLVPDEVVSAWRKRMEEDCPCISFYTTKRSTLVDEKSGVSEVKIEHSKPDELLRILRDFKKASSKKAKERFTVGVFGVTNVGKRTFISSIKDGCKIAEADEDRTLPIANGISLYEFPATIPTRAFRYNYLTPFVNIMTHPGLTIQETDVEKLLEHAPAQALLDRYSIGTWTTTHELLVRVAQRRGRLGKRGVPDATAAIRVITNDVMDGHIPFWTEVPTKEEEEREKAILSGKMVDDDDNNEDEDDEDEDDDNDEMEDNDDDDEEEEEEEEDDRLEDDDDDDDDDETEDE